MALDQDRPFSALLALEKTPQLPGPLGKEVVESGRAQCRSWRKIAKAEEPYLQEFVEKICRVWAIPPQKTAAPSELFRGISVDNQVRGLPRAFQASLRRSLQKAFEQSPWYSPNGRRALPIVLTGDFVLDHARLPEERVHGYGMRDGRPLTQTYSGWSHLQVLEFYVKGSFTPTQEAVALEHGAQERSGGFEHHWDVPQIGLTPQSAGLQDPEKWMTAQAEALAAQFLKSAKAAWATAYCEPLANEEPTLVAGGNRVQRCLRLAEEPPETVDAWYRRFLGTDAEKVQARLKQGPSRLARLPHP
ncbi:hypothetical protein K2X33_03470 [bacterium]|nr:hypothetical protein [bacterium]